MRAIGLVVLVAAAITAAVAANFVLLGYGGQPNDPVGHLTPGVANDVATNPLVTQPPPPVADDDEEDEDEEEEDD
jgi:hypothetical protein